MIIKYTTDTECSGYQISYSTNKKFKKSVKKKTVKSAKKKSLTIKKLKKGKTYYFRVRAYVLNGMELYSCYQNKTVQNLDKKREYHLTYRKLDSMIDGMDGQIAILLFF
ncbi:MAG: fibronectin type III domain-containing protein [Lachnospiraceae bacterium]|nr:fibronectin type III domain-containing protein [Lachnospiraceae bacterium]